MKTEVTPSELSELFIRGFKPLDEDCRTKLVMQLDAAYCSSSETSDFSESWHLHHLQDSEWRGLHLLGLLKDAAVRTFVKPNYCGRFIALLAYAPSLHWFFALSDGDAVYSDEFYYPSLKEALKKVDEEFKDL